MRVETVLEQLFFKRSSLDKEDKEICMYGLRLLLMTIVDYAVLLIVAAIMKKAEEGVLFLFTYSSIRSQAGGYHSDTKLGCLFKFLIAFIFFLVIPDVMPFSGSIYALLCAAIFVPALTLAPVESVHIKIDQVTKRNMKKRATLLSLTWGTICLVLYITKNSSYVYISSGLAWMGMVLIAGKIKLHKEKINEKN